MDGRRHVQLSDLEDDLLDDKHPDDIFIRKFLLFASGTILMPTTVVVVGTTILSFINGVHSVKNLNWATQCLSHLVKAIMHYKKRKGEFIGGCVLFLQVFYLHHLEGHSQFIDRSKVPITAWTEKKTRAVLRWIKASGGYSVKKMRSSMVEESGVGRRTIETHAFNIMTEVNRTKDVVSELAQQLSKFKEDMLDVIRREVRGVTSEALDEANSNAGKSDEVRRSVANKSTGTEGIQNDAPLCEPPIKHVAGAANEGTSISEIMRGMDNIEDEFASVFKSLNRIHSGQSKRNVVGSSDLKTNVNGWLAAIDPPDSLRSDEVVDVTMECTEISDSETRIAEFVRQNHPRDPTCLLKEYVASKGRRVGNFLLRFVVKPTDLCVALYVYDESLKNSEILDSFGRFSLRRMHLVELAPGRNISGVIIDCYARCLTEALRREFPNPMEQPVWVLPTRISVLYATLKEEGIQKHIKLMHYAEAEEWRRNFLGDVRACDKTANTKFHSQELELASWSRHRRGCIAMDSVSCFNRYLKFVGVFSCDMFENAIMQVSVLANLLASDLELAYDDGLNLSSFKVVHKKDIPTQANGNDCGIFVLKFMWAAATGNTVDSKFDLEEARFFLSLELVRSKIKNVREGTLNAVYKHSKDVMSRYSLQELSTTTEEKVSAPSVVDPEPGVQNLAYATKKKRALRWGRKGFNLSSNYMGCLCVDIMFQFLYLRCQIRKFLLQVGVLGEKLLALSRQRVLCLHSIVEKLQ
ncbi:hypothetical protein L484_014840 [Morus notabilis]|uniref:Ubiquitin-like protease family profile domain-containing protein n=1 Tax=Morus notabilis TaxID=981085 RepID=W9QPN6_9ROSA|nr:hypothetical protein L484_014840 [Morus notabilis]